MSQEVKERIDALQAEIGQQRRRIADLEAMLEVVIHDAQRMIQRRGYNSFEQAELYARADKLRKGRT